MMTWGARSFLRGLCLALATVWCLFSEARSQGMVSRAGAITIGPAHIGAVRIGWSPASLEATVPAGGVVTRTATFTTDEALSGVQLAIVPALVPYVHAAPVSFATIQAGDSVIVTVTFTVPEGTPPAAIEGTVRMLSGTRTIPRPLPVTLRIVESLCDARPLLFNRQIAAADDCLQSTLARNPDDQEANLFRAITRILRIVEDRVPGSDPSTFTDSLVEMLDRFGALVEDKEPFGLFASLPDIMRPDSPTGGDVQEFFRRVLIPALDGAIDENLRRATPSFSMTVSPAELAGVGLVRSQPVEIDFGDVALLQSALAGLRGFLLQTLLVYDANVDLDDYDAAPPPRFPQGLLDAYPDFLGLTADGAAPLMRAKASYLAAIDSYFAGSHFIRRLDDADQSDDLLAIADDDVVHELRFRGRLGEARCALVGERYLGLTDTGADCAPGPPILRGQVVDLAAWFDHAVALRDLFPHLAHDETCNREFVDILSPTAALPFPDPTMNGLFPGETQEDLIRRRRLAPRLETFPSLLLYASRYYTPTFYIFVWNESHRYAAPLRITGLHFERGEVFSLAGVPPILPLSLCKRNSKLYVEVRFTPTASAAYADTLVVESSDPESPRRIRIMGCSDPDHFYDCDRDDVWEYRDGDDNCYGVYNPSQVDADGDNVGDPCDNCPLQADTSQRDTDGDGQGDLCDPCPLDPLDDADGDGSCASADPCPRDPENDADGDGRCADVDNCPLVANADQRNSDGDLAGDACDVCPLDPLPDIDRDGLCGNVDPCPLDPANDVDGDGRCGNVDNCPAVANGDQFDSDGDGPGDACDNCPHTPNASQVDADADGIGDLCDNCPATPNPDQSDHGADGAGDACQPTIDIDSVREDGGPALEVTVTLHDPNGDPLHGTVRVGDAPLNLPDFLAATDCGAPLPPESLPGQGIAFGSLSGTTYLFDADRVAAEILGVTCQDGAQDYELALGACAQVPSGFDYFFDLMPLTPPQTFCVRRPGGAARFDLTLLAITKDHAVVQLTADATPYAGSVLPQAIGLSRLTPGEHYQLWITATDGNTPEVTDSISFLYQGESVIQFQAP